MRYINNITQRLGFGLIVTLSLIALGLMTGCGDHDHQEVLQIECTLPLEDEDVKVLESDIDITFTVTKNRIRPGESTKITANIKGSYKKVGWYMWGVGGRSKPPGNPENAIVFHANPSSGPINPYEVPISVTVLNNDNIAFTETVVITVSN